ncbi:hypothetical protein ACSSS7_007349 [Eimeria intestinalis]
MSWSAKRQVLGARAAATARSINTSTFASDPFPAWATSWLPSRRLLERDRQRGQTEDRLCCSRFSATIPPPPVRPRLQRRYLPAHDQLAPGMKWISAVGYVEGIIVYSDTWGDRRQHLKALLEGLRDVNLQHHPGKCCFRASSVPYLRHIHSRKGIQACPSKFRAILELPTPTCVKDIQRFLDKCQYYRRYVTNFFAIAAPLHQATCKQRDFAWPPEGQAA